MKKFLYIVYIIGLLISLQSCNRSNGVNNDSQQEQSNENHNDAENQTDSASSNKSAVMRFQLQQRDSIIKTLTDSLNVANKNIATLQADVSTLKKEQTNLKNDKIGIKELIYLAIFIILLVAIRVVLKEKLVKESNLNEEKVKNIVKYILKNHQETVCEKANSNLTLYTSRIDSHARDIKELKTEVNDLLNKLNGNGVNSHFDNNQNYQQSWEIQAPDSPQKINKQKIEKNNVFYMKRPLQNMEFDLSLKSENPTEDTYYRFEIDAKQPNFAHFYFECNSPAAVRWALNTKDKTLDRVCDASGDGNNGKYQCKSSGEAKFQDNKWVVTRKAVVIFE